MKKSILIAASAFILLSCNKEAKVDPISPASNTTYPTALNPSFAAKQVNIGEVHIDALTYCYNQMATLPPNSVTRDTDGFALIQEFCCDYLSTLSSIGMSKSEIKSFYVDASLNYQTCANAIDDQSTVIANLISNCPVDEQPLLKKLFEGLNTAENLQEYKTITDGILSEAQSLSPQRRTEIAHCVDIALSSWIYWVENNNIAKWNVLLQTVGAHKLDTRATKIIGADILGGIRGAAAGAGFAGVGALTGAMIAAAFGICFCRIVDAVLIIYV